MVESEMFLSNCGVMYPDGARRWLRLAMLLLALLGLAVAFSSLTHVQPALADDGGGDGGDGDSDSDSDSDSDGDSDDGGGGSGGAGGGGGSAANGGASGGANDGGGRGYRGGSNWIRSRRHRRAGAEDHEYAWRARRRGDIRALRGILERIRRRFGGRVLDVRLERKKGRSWYEIRILDRHDRVRKVRVPISRRKRNFRAGRH